MLQAQDGRRAILAFTGLDSLRAWQLDARPVPVTVELYQSGLDHYWQDSRIVAESLQSERQSSDQVLWRVQVPANGTVTVDATFQTRH